MIKVTLAQYDAITNIVQATMTIPLHAAKHIPNAVDITSHPDLARIENDPRNWVLEDNGSIVELRRNIGFDEINSFVDKEIEASNWTAQPGAPLTSVEASEWADYRQNLENLRDSYEPTPTPAYPAPPIEPVDDLPRYKVMMNDRLHSVAETHARRLLGGGARIALTYQEKLSEARTVRAAGSGRALVETDFPYLSLEIGVTAPTLKSVASAVIQKANAWNRANARIERERQVFQNTAESATTRGEVTQAFFTAAQNIRAVVKTVT